MMAICSCLLCQAQEPHWETELVVYLTTTHTRTVKKEKMSRLKRLSEQRQQEIDWPAYTQRLSEACVVWSQVKSIRMTENLTEANVIVYVGETHGAYGLCSLRFDENLITAAHIALSTSLLKEPIEVQQWVCVHELGHALGLQHPNVESGPLVRSVMHREFTGETGLTYWDLTEIRKLYPARSSR